VHGIFPLVSEYRYEKSLQPEEYSALMATSCILFTHCSLGVKENQVLAVVRDI
jgi:hypothetical protein